MLRFSGVGVDALDVSDSGELGPAVTCASSISSNLTVGDSNVGLARSIRRSSSSMLSRFIKGLSGLDGPALMLLPLEPPLWRIRTGRPKVLTLGVMIGSSAWVGIAAVGIVVSSTLVPRSCCLSVLVALAEVGVLSLSLPLLTTRLLQLLLEILETLALERFGAVGVLMVSRLFSPETMRSRCFAALLEVGLAKLGALGEYLGELSFIRRPIVLLRGIGGGSGAMS